MIVNYQKAKRFTYTSEFDHREYEAFVQKPTSPNDYTELEILGALSDTALQVRRVDRDDATIQINVTQGGAAGGRVKLVSFSIPRVLLADFAAAMGLTLDKS